MLLRSLSRAGSRLSSSCAFKASLCLTATRTVHSGEASDFLLDNPSLAAEFYQRNPVLVAKKLGDQPIKWTDIDWESVPGPAELFEGTFRFRELATTVSHSAKRDALHKALWREYPDWSFSPSATLRYDTDPNDRTLFVHDLVAWQTNPYEDKSIQNSIGIPAPPYIPHTVFEVVSGFFQEGERSVGRGFHSLVDSDVKLRLLPRFQVPYYWLIWNIQRKIEVFQLERDPSGDTARNKYRLLVTAHPDSGTVHLPPFERVGINTADYLAKLTFFDPNDPFD